MSGRKPGTSGERVGQHRSLYIADSQWEMLGAICKRWGERSKSKVIEALIRKEADLNALESFTRTLIKVLNSVKRIERFQGFQTELALEGLVMAAYNIPKTIVDDPQLFSALMAKYRGYLSLFEREAQNRAEREDGALFRLMGNADMANDLFPQITAKKAAVDRPAQTKQTTRNRKPTTPQTDEDSNT